MGDPPKRPPTKQFGVVVREENVAPLRDRIQTAQPVPRTQTPVAMPAPPPAAEVHERESSDDLEQVLHIDKLERERAQLLVQVQDANERAEAAELDAKRARTNAPTLSFPPPPVEPPPSEKPPRQPEPTKTRSIKPPLTLSEGLTRLAVGSGLFIAIAWNSFNSARIDKVKSVEQRVTLSEKERELEVEQRVLRDQSELQRWRAVHCYMGQLRGAIQRQGLDLPELPPGGIKVLKLAEEPNRPPQFVADGKCPEFPKLPPESPGR